MFDNELTIKLEPGGRAPILSYNVPEPTSYPGLNFIDLQVPAEDFSPTVGLPANVTAPDITPNSSPIHCRLFMLHLSVVDGLGKRRSARIKGLVRTQTPGDVRKEEVPLDSPVT